MKTHSRFTPTHRAPLSLRRTRSGAFTLVELLVVIVIIGILVGISVPVYTTAIKTARMATSMQNGRQIALALRMYANDSNGQYPATNTAAGNPILTSNDAFRDLLPAYLDNEQVFVTPPSKTGAKCDNKIEPAQECVKAGENEFAYIEGLTTTSPSSWPLLVSGTDGTGKYTDQEGDFGGTWGGVKAVVVNVDGSTSIVKTKGTGASRIIPRYNDDSKDALALTEYMGATVRLLDPARP